MKRITTCIVLTGFIWSGLGIFSTPKLKSAIAQTQEAADLFYLYKGESIPLNQRQDAIAVFFKDLPPTRTLGAATPLYLQLQQDLKQSLMMSWKLLMSLLVLPIVVICVVILAILVMFSICGALICRSLVLISEIQASVIALRLLKKYKVLNQKQQKVARKFLFYCALTYLRSSSLEIVFT